MSTQRAASCVCRALAAVATLGLFACAEEESSRASLRSSSEVQIEGAVELYCFDPENPGYTRACEEHDQVAWVHMRSYDSSLVERVRRYGSGVRWHLRLVAEGEQGVGGEEDRALYYGQTTFVVERITDDGAFDVWLPWDWFCGLPDSEPLTTYHASIGASEPPRRNAAEWFSHVELVGQPKVLWPGPASTCDEVPLSHGFARVVCVGKLNDSRCEGEQPTHLLFVVEDSLLWALAASAREGRSYVSRLEIDIYDYQSEELLVADTLYDTFDVANVASAANGSWTRVLVPITVFARLGVRYDWVSPFEVNSARTIPVNRHATGYITGARLSVRAIDRFFETEFVVGGDPELIFWPAPGSAPSR